MVPRHWEVSLELDQWDPEAGGVQGLLAGAPMQLETDGGQSLDFRGNEAWGGEQAEETPGGGGVGAWPGRVFWAGNSMKGGTERTLRMCLRISCTRSPYTTRPQCVQSPHPLGCLKESIQRWLSRLPEARRKLF